MLTDADFAIVADEMKRRTGTIIPREWNAIAETRLAPLARREGYGAVAELIQIARIKNEPRTWTAIADALLQTETRFFRDRGTFERLRKDIIPELVRRRQGGHLKIWCAGAGTGQEAYSIAMLMDELRAEGLPGAEITATDVSERQLEKARAGLYTQFEVQRGLPIRKLIAYFEKAGDLWRISDRLRAAVRFEAHNLLTHPGELGRFDIILCCNVITAFGPATRIDTINRIGDALAPDGVLILGAHETLPDGAGGFAGGNGIFQRSAAARKAA
ncbi:MAG: protein-glutamate O-methyltransferase CheR [Hyphomonadaceae bacterium]